MTIIAEKDRETIRQMLATELADDVELLFFTRPPSTIYVPGREDCSTCEETRELVEELVELSENLSLTTYDLSTNPTAATTYNVNDVPAVLLRRKTSTRDGEAKTTSDASDDDEATPPPNVRFLGLPSGYEFSTLLADLVDISKGRTDLSEATREAVRAIDEPVHIRVFVTPT